MSSSTSLTLPHHSLSSGLPPLLHKTTHLGYHSLASPETVKAVTRTNTIWDVFSVHGIQNPTEWQILHRGDYMLTSTLDESQTSLRIALWSLLHGPNLLWENTVTSEHGGTLSCRDNELLKLSDEGLALAPSYLATGKTTIKILLDGKETGSLPCHYWWNSIIPIKTYILTFRYESPIAPIFEMWNSCGESLLKISLIPESTADYFSPFDSPLVCCSNHMQYWVRCSNRSIIEIVDLELRTKELLDLPLELDEKPYFIHILDDLLILHTRSSSQENYINIFNTLTKNNEKIPIIGDDPRILSMIGNQDFLIWSSQECSSTAAIQYLNLSTKLVTPLVLGTALSGWDECPSPSLQLNGNLLSFVYFQDHNLYRQVVDLTTHRCYSTTRYNNPATAASTSWFASQHFSLSNDRLVLSYQTSQFTRYLIDTHAYIEDFHNTPSTNLPAYSLRQSR